MRKLGLFALVLGLVFAFAMPAPAITVENSQGQKLNIGALIFTDVAAWNRSKELDVWGGGNKSDRTELAMSLARHSRLLGSFASGPVGGYFDLRFGRDAIASHDQTDAMNAADKFSRMNYTEAAMLYGWYKFGNCTFKAGKMDGSVFTMTPAQSLGFENNNHIVGFGWGAMYDDRAAQIRYEQAISKLFTYQISLIQPSVFEIGTGATSQDSYAQIPRIDLLFTLNFGMVQLNPGVSWQTVKFDNVPTGYDDSLIAWVAVLPVKFMAGGFAATAQVAYGQNLSVYPLQSAFHAVQRDAGGKIKPTTGLNGFINLAYTAGPVTPALYFGYDKAENTDVYLGDKYNVRMMYGANLTYKVAPNFNIVPELTFYDYGKNPKVAANTDIGKEWLAGVQFQFMF